MKQLFLSLLLGCTFSTVCCAFGDLSSSEEDTLKTMREEEKLARDVYLEMNDTWEHKLFANIAESEQRHMDAMLKMIELYGLEDPVGDNLRGEFTNPDFGLLYGELTDQGKVSLLDAFLTGASFEDMDMYDLAQAISQTDEDPLKRAYSHLLSASCNHLRAFVSHVNDQGESYEPKFISPEVYAECVNLNEKVPVSNGGFSINPGLNDTWYYPGTDGQGFAITVYPGVKLVSLIWFTYGIELPDPYAPAAVGNPGQRWVAAVGPYSGSEAELELYSMFGGLFDDPQAVPLPDYDGSIKLYFENCDSGTVSYDIPSAGLSGMVPIQRVNSANVARCLQEEHKHGNSDESEDDTDSDY